MVVPSGEDTITIITTMDRAPVPDLVHDPAVPVRADLVGDTLADSAAAEAAGSVVLAAAEAAGPAADGAEEKEKKRNHKNEGLRPRTQTLFMKHKG